MIGDDPQLEALRQRWLMTRSHEDQVEYLRAWATDQPLRAERLNLATHYGHRAARHACEGPLAQLANDAPVDRESRTRRALATATCAFEAALRHRLDPDPLSERALQTLLALRAWVRAPDPEQLARLRDLSQPDEDDAAGDPERPRDWLARACAHAARCAWAPALENAAARPLTLQGAFEGCFAAARTFLAAELGWDERHVDGALRAQIQSDVVPWWTCEHDPVRWPGSHLSNTDQTTFASAWAACSAQLGALGPLRALLETCDALHWSCSERALADWRQDLHGDHRDAARYAAARLGELEHLGVACAAVGFANDQPEPALRVCVALGVNALALLPEVVRHLPNSSLRDLALTTIATLGVLADGAIDCVLPLLDDPVARPQALQTLARMGPAAIPHLPHDDMAPTPTPDPQPEPEPDDELPPETLQEIEALRWRWVMTGAVPDLVGWVSARARAGQVSPQRLGVAAKLGYAPAQSALVRLAGKLGISGFGVGIEAIDPDPEASARVRQVVLRTVVDACTPFAGLTEDERTDIRTRLRAMRRRLLGEDGSAPESLVRSANPLVSMVRLGTVDDAEASAEQRARRREALWKEAKGCLSTYRRWDEHHSSGVFREQLRSQAGPWLIGERDPLRDASGALPPQHAQAFAEDMAKAASDLRDTTWLTRLTKTCERVHWTWGGRTPREWAVVLAQTNEATRWLAAEEMIRAGRPMIILALTALREGTPEVQREAVIVLREIGPEAIAALPMFRSRLIESRDPALRRELVGVLTAWGDHAAELRPYADPPAQPTPAPAPPPTLLTEHRERVLSEDWDDVLDGARALLDRKATIPELPTRLAEMLRDADAQRAAQAAELLSRVHTLDRRLPDAAFEVLRAARNHPNPTVAQAATDAAKLPWLRRAD